MTWEHDVIDVIRMGHRARPARDVPVPRAERSEFA